MHIPVAQPALIGNEKQYVMDCLESTWISSTGKYVDQFEAAFAEYCNVKHGISCCNGTAALHLALMALGIQPGDEVIVPTLTFIASANAITYCGAKPVFIDSDPANWNLDPSLLDNLVTPKTKAILVVHLYGHPANMDPILEFARRHNLFVVEDAAEAHGALYKGTRVGSIGDISTFSFYGNKIITTGEGGMVVTNNDEYARRVRLLKGQGMDPQRRYWFPIVGYNYRLTNVAAAIGLAQLENIDWHVSQRQSIAKQYRRHLSSVQGLAFQAEESWAQSVHWMVSVTLDRQQPLSRDMLMQLLAESGIETRPLFYPLHSLPSYSEQYPHLSLPIAEDLAARGINLPTYAGLAEENIQYICNQIKRIMG